MANSVMAAKTVKMKRMRRAWARSLSHKGGFEPNREVIKEYALRARGLGEEGPIVDYGIQPGKLEALKRQAELEAELPNGCDNRVIGPTGVDCLQESWIYFTSRKDCFVLVHRDLEQGIERKSVTFSTKELLIMVWEGGAIPWAEKKRIAR